MGKTIRLNRGFDIRINGSAQKGKIESVSSSVYALKPTDFFGIAPIPKMIPSLGQHVKAGDPLFYDKANPDLIYSAPVSGEVIELNRGEKRRVTSVVILADQEQTHKDFGSVDVDSLDGSQVKTRLIESGAWHFIRQRPFNVSADPSQSPKAIFVSGFNTGPMAPEAELVMAGREVEFKAGMRALSKLAKLHLSVELGNTIPAFKGIDGVEIHEFAGKHPAGNVGVQIHHIDPIKKGEVVWTIGAQDVITIGRLFSQGIYAPERIITIAGNAKNPGYYRVNQGIKLDSIIDCEDNCRVISGNVLSGSAIPKDGFLGFYDEQVSVVEEGDKHEFFGWLMPSYSRPTRSKSLVKSYLSKKNFNVNTNTHGERRAFVVSGQYEDVLPMDIHPVQLLKAIIANDFDMMEGLGIYEVVEEDLALCEFVCTSKQPVQKILREGLDYMREQA